MAKQTAWDAASHPKLGCIAALHITSHCLTSLAVLSLLQPPRDRTQEGTRLPGPSPHRAPLSPHGALSLLAAPLPLPFSAYCTKGAFDLNLSAQIRVRSRSPLPSTEPRQGCEAASATVGYSGGGSARAVTMAGGRRGEKGQSRLHRARATPGCDRAEAPSHKDGLRGAGERYRVWRWRTGDCSLLLSGDSCMG